MKITYCAHVEVDIANIRGDLSEALGEEIADRFVQAVDETIASLSWRALAHRARAIGRFPNVRQAAVAGFTSYLVFYLVDDDEPSLEVLRVLYGGRNLGPLLT